MNLGNHDSSFKFALRNHACSFKAPKLCLRKFDWRWSSPCWRRITTSTRWKLPLGTWDCEGWHETGSTFFVPTKPSADICSPCTMLMGKFASPWESTSTLNRLTIWSQFHRKSSLTPSVFLHAGRLNMIQKLVLVEQQTFLMGLFLCY